MRVSCAQSGREGQQNKGNKHVAIRVHVSDDSRRDRFIIIGCAGAILAILAPLVLATGPWLLWIILAGIMLGVASDATRRRRVRELLQEFRSTYGPEKDLLIVYTESPIWQPRIEQDWLARWGQRAVLLNRSKSWSSGDLRARLWRSLGGFIEHTPLAIVVPANGEPTVVRFFTAFRDFKHGKSHRLREAEAELEAALDAA